MKTGAGMRQDNIFHPFRYTSNTKKAFFSWLNEMHRLSLHSHFDALSIRNGGIAQLVRAHDS